MNERTNAAFWRCFAQLPTELQQLAREKHRLWLQDPFHASLHFKEITPGLWSVRISAQYRTLCRRERDLVVWFWIGTHAEYDRLIK